MRNPTAIEPLLRATGDADARIWKRAASALGKLGPDVDYGSSPILFTLPTGKQVVLAGQKSGLVSAMDPVTGKTAWQTQVGYGSLFGGVEWGMAADTKTLFVATRGFADCLVIGDQARPSLFALDVVKPAPLYAGVIEADERLDAAGQVVRPLDEVPLADALARAAAEGFQSVAIAFLHADLNPAHERAAGEIARPSVIHSWR